MKTGKTEPIRIDFTAMDRGQVEEFALEKSNRVIALEAEVNYYKELLRKNRKDMFGGMSERYVSEGQISLFDEAEVEADPEAQEPGIEDVLPQQPKRKKSKGRKQGLVSGLPKETIEYALTDEERACPKCGGELKEMKTVVRHEIEVIPAKYKDVEHRTKVYSCRACDKEGTEGTVVKAPSPKGMLLNSLASPSFVADVMFKKFALSQPLHRQAQELSRIGIPIGRNVLANWMIRAASAYLMPVRDHMRRILLGGIVLFADETPVQVLDEPGREAAAKSYMWAYRSGSREARQVVLFDYAPGRGAEYPERFLSGYRGFVQCDGYSAYPTLAHVDGHGPPCIIIAACWQHARRKFTDIIKGLPKDAAIKGTVTEKAILIIGRLFEIEREAQDMAPGERRGYRKKHAWPIVDKYFDWLRSIKDSCTGSLGKAVNYSLNQEQGLRAYLLDGRLEISTNLVENAIRPFCVGRRNWLFCATPGGAGASAACYGIIETAKANGIDAREYLSYIFEVFKDADIGSLDMEDFMPWSPSLPDACRLPEKAEAQAS
jgi:transposase